MGQQVKFETLDLAATALRREALRRGNAEPAVAVRMLRFDDDAIARAELTLTDAGGAARAVHLFEAYWAPLTEGQIGVLQTLAFLVRSGWAGLRRSARGCFHRFMFGRNQRLPVGPRAGLAFLAALAALLAFLSLSAEVTGVALTRIITGGRAAWPDPRLLVDLTLDVLALFGSLGLAAIGIGLAASGRRIGTKGSVRVPSPARVKLAWALVWSAFPLMLASGALAAWHVVIHCCAGVEHPLWCGWPPFAAAAAALGADCPPLLFTLLAMLLWGSLLAVAVPLRGVIVQFAGDVAIYVSAFTVNRFQKTRDEIQAAGLQVARCVYEWSEPGEAAPHYDRVIVVGHSLGSVIAYDTLNAMLREDALDGGGLAVADRTSMLLTFGSPLDKTAFLFRNQRDETSDVREALAAAVQPLIRDYALRPARWVNLWSPGDWIGAKLSYYDDPAGAGGAKRIENLVDPDATTPLMAHNEHWDGRLLGRLLYDEATR